jgi:hypothetical protein
MSSAPNEPSGLGSLAQSARGKHLNQARGILIVIGVITILFNGVFGLFLAPDIVRKEIQAEISKAGPRAVIDQAKVKEIEESEIRATQLIAGGTAFLGFVFIVLGLLVRQYPVPATALGLVLYVGSYVIFALLDPQNIYRGIIIKIIIIVLLVKSLQAAIAYQKEQQAAQAAPESPL